MESFFIIFLCLFAIYFIGALSPHNWNRRTFIVAFFFLFILSAFRAPSIGNDTQNYIDIFQNISELMTSETRYEIGYLYLNDFIYNHVSDSYRIFFIITSAFIYFSFGRFILKYSKTPWLSLMIFMYYGFFSFSISGLRQTIAMAICTYALSALIDNKKILSCLIICFASLFHSSAILFIAILIFPYLKLSDKTIAILFATTIFIASVFNIVLSDFLSIFGQYEHYTDNDSMYSTGGVRIASIFNALICTLVFIYGYAKLKFLFRHSDNDVEDTQYSNKIFLFCLAISSAIYILSLQFNMLDRIALYYNMAALIILPNAIYMLKPINTKTITAISVILFFISYQLIIAINRPEWNNIYPYKFEFL